MGRLKPRYNEKARQRQPAPDTDKLARERRALLTKLHMNVADDGDQYETTRDESNSLVLVKTAEKKQNKQQAVGTKKVLSKKQQKKLQRITEMKAKKRQRTEVLKSLAEHQTSASELALYSTTTSIGQREKRKTETVPTDVIPPPRRKRKRKMAKKKNKIEEEEEECELVEEKMEPEYNDGDDDDDTSSDDEDMKPFAPDRIDEELTDINIVEASERGDDKEQAMKADKVQPINKHEPLAATNPPKPPSQSREPQQPIFVEVKRSAEIQAARLALPILPEEQVVMETINENDFVVICGETGSGKTTQVPQFLYEAGYGSHPSRSGMIGVTQPRRVAAVCMSQRVAMEMSLSTNHVAYQIRYEGNTSDETKLKFMTDGVLLKEMESDFLLSRYSVVILDEAHERSVFTDILIGLLSRVVPLRRKQGRPLKLVVMSATLRVQDFTENERLFKCPPPVVTVEARQFPVTVHFNKRTPDDYVTAAYNKVCKIHRKLNPDGGILVFVTGQNEVHALCRNLRKTFPITAATAIASTASEVGRTREQRRENFSKKHEVNLIDPSEQPNRLPNIDLDDYSTDSMLGSNTNSYKTDDDDDDDDGEDLISDDDEGEDTSAYSASVDASSPLHVLPLYSVLSSEKQARVFAAVPEGTRLCVVATNVAETSLTIPGIKFIVDSGKVKRKVYDKLTGVSSFRVDWTSQASAHQRTGRAGRVAAGHCYRLYSAAVFQNDFDEFSQPEITRRPVEDLVLQMKNMMIEKVTNFPFPTPPDRTALQAAESLLIDLKALVQDKNRATDDVIGVKQSNTSAPPLARITPLGRRLASVPVAPRFARMLLDAAVRDDGCLQFAVAIVAALTVRDIFTDDIDVSQVQKDADHALKRQLITHARRKWAGSGAQADLADLMVILRAVGACEFARCTEEFCARNGLRHKSMVEIRKLRAQLTNSLNSLRGGNVGAILDPNMSPPTAPQAERLQQIVLSSFADRVARKLSREEATRLKVKNGYQCCSTDGIVFIHPSSAMFTKLPDFLVYQEVVETKKMYMRNVSCIRAEWLALYAAHKCTFSKPLESLDPTFDQSDGVVKCHMTYTYGPHLWQLPAQSVEYPSSPEKYRWFARLLLSGEVFPKLSEFACDLLTPASVITKSWAHLQPRCEQLYCALLSKRVDSRARMRFVWKTDSDFLLNEYLMWLPETRRDQVQSIWRTL